MPLIEVLPNSTSISAPGWAYVPDTGYDPSKAPIQPGARKRNARVLGPGGADTTARQNTAVLKRLADLDKDNFKDVQITIPSKQKDSVGRVSKGKTAASRKILLAQKTFANYVADEEALAALEPHASNAPKPRTSAANQLRRSSTNTRDTSISGTPQLTRDSSVPNVASGEPQRGIQPFGYPRPDLRDLRLLDTAVPKAPSEAVMDALVSAPQLSYGAARSEPSSSGQPQRHFCEFCGYWGKVKCIKCGARVCGLACKKTHDEERCLRYSG